MTSIRTVDSHTGGEPTRVVVAGGPDLGKGNVAEQARVFRAQHDAFRRAVVCEPRGHDVLVGAMLVPPADASCTTGVIYFNNVGVLGMCGHGTIGLIVTLAHLGRIRTGVHRIETNVGIVTATLHGDGTVSVANIPSWRTVRAISVDIPGHGKITGDIAWAGNWFFLTADHGQQLRHADAPILTTFATRIRSAVNENGYPEVDHIELFGPAQSGGHSRNFVLCPGGAYDRSPCGTGTSAKLACLAAEGTLAEGDTWTQESIIGSKLTGTYRWLDRPTGKIAPTITGTAHITAETTLLLDDTDPFCWGIQ